MKVAFFTYPSAFQNVGGGEILLLKLREYLQKQSVQVDLFDTWHSRVEEYDFIHVFGSVKDCLGLVQVANARRVKVAITPLIWSDWRRALFSDGPISSKVDFLLRHTAKVLLPSLPSKRRALLACSDLIFPNSQIELHHISRLFAISKQKMRVVYNGVDPVFCEARPDLFRKRHGDEPFVLGVGRIEPRKNQLNLIKAIRCIPGLRLVLIGSPVTGYESYYQACQREGGNFTTFYPTMKHEDPALGSAYSACDLFVLQGWFETPGLVAMEAALAGARVLATMGGSTREYFENHVEYLDPANPKQISEKIKISLNAPKTDALKNHILNRFTWDKIAEQTLRCYAEFR